MRANLATLVDEFRSHAAETAVVAHRGNRRYATSYGELAEIAGRFAAELERRGIAPGERVVLWGANSAEWIGVFFGCMLRGVLAVPLDAAGDAGFAGRVIGDVGPRLIVGDAHLLAALQGTGNGEQDAENELALAGIAARLPAEALFAVEPSVGAQTAFQIVFTSGTTAEPRGIVHTHRNILVSLGPIEKEMAKYRGAERVFHPLRLLHSVPLSHVFGQFMGLWIPALLAAEVHFAEELEPARIANLIRRERISVLIAVPRVLHLLRAHLLARFPELAAEIDASAGVSMLKRWWRFRRVHGALGWKFWAVISGGATLPAELEGFWNQLGFALIQGYGMTETAALVTLNHPFHIKQGTIGKPLPGREVKITDDGEILVRGEMLAGATWSGGAMHQREGEWLATGDLAGRDAAGDLLFLGRKGDVIVTSAGLNIHPGDLEAALSAQPGIRAAVVVPCELVAGTEAVAVVIAAGGETELQAAVAAANRSLAEFQQIRRVLRWPELQFPYTSTGKLLRRQVARWAGATLAGGRAGGRGAAAAPNGDAVLALIVEVMGEPAPAAGDPNALRLSEDLHLDSLGRVQLQSAIEQRFSLELEDDAVATVETLGDLRRLLEGQLIGVKPAPQNPSALEQRSTGGGDQPAAQPATGIRRPETAEAHLYPRWPWSRPILALRVVWIELIMRPLVWLLAAPRVRYAPGASAQLQPATPLLIVCNHVTAYDGGFVLYALPPYLRRRVAAAMSGEMLMDYRNSRGQGNWFLNRVAPAAYWLLTTLFNVFPLPRARGFRRSFAHAGAAMDRGYSVLIFPEGTRSRTGHMGAFRPGIGLLARQSQVPILPVALAGLYDDDAGGSWFHSGRVEVRIGQLIPAPGEDADPAALTAQLEQSLRAILGQ